jgi:UPF0755 protein
MKKFLVVTGAALAVAVLLAAGFGGWLLRGAAGARGPAEAADVVFEVRKGTSGQKLGEQLVGAGLVEHPWFWRVHLRTHPGFAPKAGKHTLSARMTIPEIATALEAAPLAEDQPFVMIEGWRLADTDEALAAKGWIKPGAYVAAAHDVRRYKAPFPLPARGLEGYLYPETYRVVVEGGFDPALLIQRQLDTFVERFWQPHRAEVEASGRTLDDVVVMASMLEREEPKPAQRPVVAGILWKRIAMKFPLGVDATSRYALRDWNDRAAFLKRLRDPDDAYNTRLKVGLPPGPIGSPTVASLEAALRPQASEFLYYLHDADKNLHPSRNAAEHEALRARYNVY